MSERDVESDAPVECRYPCACGQFPEDHCSCMDGHARDRAALLESLRKMNEAAAVAERAVGGPVCGCEPNECEAVGAAGCYFGASGAVSSRYRVTCPACKAAPGMPCRTLKTGRVTDTHMDRIRTQHDHEGANDE